MYTGTLISELMSTAERVAVQQTLEQERISVELHEIFTMQIPVTDPAYMGAA